MTIRRIISIILSLSIFASMISVMAVGSLAAEGGITKTEGWFESASVEWTATAGADGYKVYIAKDGSDSWTLLDDALVRRTEGGYRADAVGLGAGKYLFKIVPIADGAEQTALTSDSVTVLPYDRSGYAHFNYTEGVGAYKDDGMLKDNAIVLYVTEENKNTVSVTSKDGTTVVGIGNILNSVGKSAGGGKTAAGGIANTNSDIIRKLAEDGTPLVVRIIGRVTAPEGLTAFDSKDYGGSEGDNGFMARMQGGKDVTIEGVGYDATIDGWGLHFMCQTSDYSRGFGRSFEVRNIAFRNVPEDCVGMEGVQSGSNLTAPVERCWIHHCSFYAPKIANPAESDKDGGDGACDFKRGQYFTNSYCLYSGYHKTNLLGASDSNLQFHITYHHNYWRNCESRGPLARQANIHMYNNIFEGQTSYCMNPRENGYIFSEYNLFLNSKNPVTIRSGAVKSYGDSFVNCTRDNDATIVSDRSTVVSSANRYASFELDSTVSYIPTGEYIIQESIAEMKAVVSRDAGHRGHESYTPDDSAGSGSEGGSGTGSGTGSSGSTPEVIVPAGNQFHSFTAHGKVDPEGFFSFTDCNTSDSKGSVTLNGETLTVCLKIESKTQIGFASEAGKLILVFGGTTSAAGKQIKLDGKSYDIGADQTVTIEVAEGRHTVTKDDSINLFYMSFLPNEVHTHSYERKQTNPATCTEAGLDTYICSCGDSYTETVEASGHDFSDGFCVNCGIDDPDYIPEDDPTVDPAPDPDPKPDPEPIPDHENPEDDEPEEELGFFERIWKAIVDFFKWLFGIEE